MYYIETPEVTKPRKLGTMENQLNLVATVNGPPSALETFGAQPGDVEPGQLYDFIIALQSTLDIERLLEIFARRTRAVVSCHGIVYRNAALDLRLQDGQERLHRCGYQLTQASENLGEVVFSRRKAFSVHEISRLEVLLSALVYPLRNALLYRSAREEATRDVLTGLRNRKALDDHLELEIERAQRYATTLSMLVIDADRFKQVNDNYGHLAGDHLLVQISRVLTDLSRNSDLVFRFGGDEFVVLLPNTDKSGARTFAERIRQHAGAMECSFGGNQMAISVSIGVAELARGGKSDGFFKAADEAMLVAKTRGSDRVVTA